MGFEGEWRARRNAKRLDLSIACANSREIKEGKLQQLCLVGFGDSLGPTVYL
jgi:hypothetical protein